MFIRAVVCDIVQGRHGPYAVAQAEGVEGSITFALTRPCWQEEDVPELGVCVVLWSLRRKRAGWRAMKARLVQLSDEVTPETTERK